MLKFNTWPPTEGKVEFSENSQRIIDAHEQAFNESSESSKTLEDLLDLAHNCGTLIAANTDAITTTHLREELSEAIPEETRMQFVVAYQRGVNDETTEGGGL